MFERLKQFLNASIGPHLPMRIRFFNLCTLGGTLGALLATIAPACSGMYNPIGLALAGLTSLFFAGLFIASQITKKYYTCILIGITGLNFIIYPILYFTMGGIAGGMVLYFIMGIVFTLLLLDLKESLIIFPLEVLCYGTIFALGFKKPELFLEIVHPENYVLDTALDFMIVSLTTFFVIKILYNAYEEQQERAEELVKELEDLTITDPLTKVRNRRYLIQAIELEIIKSNRENYDISIIMFDIDHFKKVNDTYGHLIGDEVLKSFSSILLNNCREYDTVARYGGEEFVILLPKTNGDVAFSRAEAIRSIVESSELSASQHIPLTVSGGVAVYNSSLMTSVEQFIQHADDFLYEAKETGRNKIIWEQNTGSTTME